MCLLVVALGISSITNKHDAFFCWCCWFGELIYWSDKHGYVCWRQQRNRYIVGYISIECELLAGQVSYYWIYVCFCWCFPLHILNNNQNKLKTSGKYCRSCTCLHKSKISTGHKGSRRIKERDCFVLSTTTTKIKKKNKNKHYKAHWPIRL